MEPPSDVLAAVADAIAEGQPIDWRIAESDKLTPIDREMLSQLRVLEGVRSVHRLADSALQSPDVSSDDPTSDAAVDDATTRTHGIHGKQWAHLELGERLGGGAFG